MRFHLSFILSFIVLAGTLAAGCGSSPGGTVGDGSVPDAQDATGFPDGGPVCAVEDGSLTVAPEGAFLAQGETVDGTRLHCEAVIHAVAGAAASSLRVTLMRWTGSSAAMLRVTDLLGDPVSEISGARAGSTVRVTLDRSGEYLVRLEPEDPEADRNAYRLAAECVQGCDIEYTRYPVVFLHGAAGTDTYINILDYWFGIYDHLTSRGYLVFTPAVDAFGTPQTRAEEHRAHLDQLVADGMGRRFNLIAHSQGGLDGRYLISGLSDPRPVSLIMVATPNRGTAVADLANRVLNWSDFAADLVDDVLNMVTEWLGLGQAAAADQLASFTTPAMEQFNIDMPDDPGVYYASWSGHTCGILESQCRNDWNDEVVDTFLAPTYRLLQAVEGDNDGLVSVTSAQWGEFMGELPADHMDEVGQIGGQITGPFDPLTFYLDEVRRLSSMGF